MSFQLLKGVQVVPIGSRNQSRWSSYLVDGSFPQSSFAGGWIFASNVDIGFSERPTEIKLNIVLETIDKAQQHAKFDINDNDLDCSAGNGADESLFNIDFNGIVFNSFVLYSYDISIENNAKILTVTFKDYSIILDKIYVGLIKRQGWTFPHSASSTLSFNVRCPDCILAGNSFTQEGIAYRDIAFGSYVGINGKSYDNFVNTDSSIDVFSQWMDLFHRQTTPFPNKLDLNGGFLIIGTEEATEERCGNLANVSYNFNELLASLRVRGLSFTGVFPYGQSDSDFIYKQNYNGTLREVLQQWCSDLGYSFYCEGKNFVGLSLTKPLDIESVTQIADPTTLLGSQFATNANSAIISYKSTSTLDNTFTQSVITENNRVRDFKVDSKSPKRYVGILPLHPIDFNIRNEDTVMRTTALGIPFFDIGWSNSFERNSPTLTKTFSLLDNRTFDDTDTAIALGKYDSNLRDIFCQDQAIYGNTAEKRASNFRALGYVPLVEVTGQEMSWAIESLVRQEDTVNDICLDRRFYKVYIGYFYPEFRQQVLDWEQQAADSMYKYGIISEGLLNYFPYMSQNSLTDQSPTGGFYGDSGTSLLRTQHTVEPNCQQYYQLRDAPFKDIILYSGLATNNDWADANYAYNDSIGLGVNIPVAMPTGGIFPGGLFFGAINNDWGTDVEDFKRIMTMNLTDPCVQSFAQEQSYTNIQNGITTERAQDWRLDAFTPKQTADIDSFYSDYQAFFQKILPVYSTLLGNVTGSIYDRTIGTYYDLHFKQKQNCSKLHIIVLTDTRNHPNISVGFEKYGTEFVNPIVLRQWVDREREAIKRRMQTETQSICSISLLQEMCKNIISGQYNSGTGDARFRCIIDEDKYNFLEDSYPLETLLQPNSRGLNINIVKNPIRNSTTDNLQATFANADINGDFYYSDIIANFLKFNQTTVNLNIIYPVSFGQQANYRGILTSQVDLENRIPEIINILGEPTNIINNRASTIKVINNTVDPDLQPQIDPYYQKFMPMMTVISGTGNIISTPQQYHDLISQLDSYQLTGAWKTVDLTLAGTPDFFGSFSGYLSPVYGMTKMSISVGDNGVTTSLSFSDRPPKLPISESILNKISARIKK
jgi:hypothetical protein